MIRRVAEIFLITITQIFCLVYVYQSLNYFIPIQHKEIGFGLLIYHSFLIFTISLLVCNYYSEFFTKGKIILVLSLLLITIILPLEAVSYRPFRSTLLIILFTIGFLSTALTNKWRKKRSR